MRHNKKFNHLGRKTAHRKAMLSNMATSLILHKRIETTVAKAKALQVYLEPLVTRAKNDSTHNRRMVFRKLQDKEAVTELFREISAKVADRPGGYTRVLKIGNRLGDNAEMCMIEFVDYNENLLEEKANQDKAKTKKTRSRRGSSAAKKTEETPADNIDNDLVEEVVAEVKETVEAPKEETSKEDKKEDKE